MPSDYIFSKGFFARLIFGRAYYRKEFCVSRWVGLDNKNSLKHEDNSLKRLKKAKLYCPWACIPESRARDLEGLFSGGLVIGILRYFTTM